MAEDGGGGVTEDGWSVAHKGRGCEQLCQHVLLAAGCAALGIGKASPLLRHLRLPARRQVMEVQ